MLSGGISHGRGLIGSAPVFSHLGAVWRGQWTQGSGHWTMDSGQLAVVALRCPHLVGPGLQVCSACGLGAPVRPSAALDPVHVPPARCPPACPASPTRRLMSCPEQRAARTSARVPGCRGACLLIIQARRWKDQLAVGWLGTGPLPPKSPRLLSDVDLRIWFESSRNSKKVGGSFSWLRPHLRQQLHALSASLLTEVHTGLLLEPSTLVPRNRTTATTASSSLFPGSSRAYCPGLSYSRSSSSSFSFGWGFTQALP